MNSPIIKIEKLGFPWATIDPFLFCVYHLDKFPKGNKDLAPDVSLAGRDLGQDFSNKDGWSMYHGTKVPGFPNHPHRGFETVTVVNQGLVDHSDSLGGQARYGNGDTQWMTAGAGISHCEMLPLLNSDKPNPLELFQIWLNLPADHKMSSPTFKVLWKSQTPDVIMGKPGKKIEIKVVAGELEGAVPPSPPPDSWASVPGTAVAIWVIKMDANTRWTLPKASKGSDINRCLYYYGGDKIEVAGQNLELMHMAQVKSDTEIDLKSGKEPVQLLMLQGKPISEPVASYGPFVMNTRAQLEQAFADYQATQFGGWPWKSNDPNHGKTRTRFVKLPKGREEDAPKG